MRKGAANHLFWWSEEPKLLHLVSIQGGVSGHAQQSSKINPTSPLAALISQSMSDFIYKVTTFTSSGSCRKGYAIQPA